MAPPQKKRESRILKDDNDDTKQFEAPGFTKNWRAKQKKNKKSDLAHAGSQVQWLLDLPQKST
jgi:hypothetical protein